MLKLLIYQFRTLAFLMTQYVLEILFQLQKITHQDILNYQWQSTEVKMTHYLNIILPTYTTLLPFLPQGLNDTTYIISLTTNNCCSHTYYDTLLIEPLPIVDFAEDSVICSGSTVSFNLEPFIFGTDSLIVDYEMVTYHCFPRQYTTVCLGYNSTSILWKSHNRSRHDLLYYHDRL